MTQYIVEKDGVRYGMFEGRSFAQRWAEAHVGGDARHVHAVNDRSEAEAPRLEVGDVVRVKDKRDRVGLPLHVRGGAEGVVARKLSRDDGPDDVVVTFHASHKGVPDMEWTSQRVNLCDLVKVPRSCSHL